MKLVLYKSVVILVDSLQKPTQAKWLRTLTLLKQYGNSLGMPHARRLDNSLSELRIRGREEVRAFFIIKDDTVIILHAFVKKTQKIPVHELAIAQKRLQSLTGYDI